MKLNPQELGKILTDHLDGLTTEEFIANVKEFCPYLFEEDNSQSQTSENYSAVLDCPSVLVNQNNRVSQESANLGK